MNTAASILEFPAHAVAIVGSGGRFRRRAICSSSESIC